MHRLAHAILLVLGLAAATAQGEGSPPAPGEVLATIVDHEAAVIWTPTPGLSGEDAGYSIYGLGASGLVRLGAVSAEDTLFVAPAGFETYGVAARLDGTESAISWVGECVAIDLTKTPPIVGTCRGSKVEPMVSLPP